MKKIFIILSFFLISSCDDLINQSEKTDFGSIKLSFNKPSSELVDSLNSENNRTQSQFVDLDSVSISINGATPTSVPIVNGSASYSKNGLPVGIASVRVDLVGAGITKYSQTKSISVIADQVATASFNAFAVTGQSMSYTSTFQSTYDGGDIINLIWSNTHAEQPVNIERWDQVGGVWVKAKTLEEEYVGTSYSWNTQGESSGESVKIRIQSTISNTFIDTQPFQLLSNEAFVVYDLSDPITYHDVALYGSNIVAVGSYTTTNQPVVVLYDLNGNWLNAATFNTAPFDNGYSHVIVADGSVFAVGTNSSSNRVYVDEIDGSLNLLTRNMHSTSGDVLAFGLESYNYNGSTHLVVPIGYDDSTYEYNSSMLSFDVSGNMSINYKSNWGWHTEEEDQFAVDVSTSGSDILVTKINDITTNPYINYYLWKNFNPSTGSTLQQSSVVYLNAIQAQLSDIESRGNQFFNSTVLEGAFSVSNTLSNYAITSFVNSFINGSTITSNEDSEWYTSPLFLNNTDYVIFGDGVPTDDTVFYPALHTYSSGSLDKRIFTEFGQGGYLIRGIKRTDGSLIAVGSLYDSNQNDDKAILYIENASNKTAGLLEFSGNIDVKSPQIVETSSGKLINAE